LLEIHRPSEEDAKWELVVSGFWSDDQYRSGHIAYYLAEIRPGHWVMNGLERNAELDGVEAEDVEAGRLNDNQIQAMWGMSLEEAHNQVYQRIVAICTDLPSWMGSPEVSRLLYDEIVKAGGKDVTEPDDLDTLL
jgi:hypothetical protein